MMAINSTSEKSVLKVRLGNLQPSESVRIEFDLIGKLASELPNQWTLRIPSHISPRYQTQTDMIATLFKKLLLSKPDLCESYVQANTEMDFKINLFSSKKILSAHSSSHKLDENIFTDLFRSYSHQGGAVPPEHDLEFTFEQLDFARPVCTLGHQCLSLTFCPPKSAKSNFDHYAGEYIFLLDQSGSMGGDRIKQAKESLILFLKSLPESSIFNVISFGSKFKRMFKTSVPYTDEYVEEAVQLIDEFDADFGGTEILNPLMDIIHVEKKMRDFIRHVILITDGQVSNSDLVIKLIGKMRQEGVATTHAIGIGNGVSFDMIRRGAI
jgi:von Willebrand factor A domain-containing protein 5